MRIFSIIVICILSMILCPWATLKSLFHFKHWHTQIYMYDFRFLMFCDKCDKVFINELTQEEVDDLEFEDD